MRWALAGYGTLAPRIVKALRDCGQTLVAVWGRQDVRADAFAREHNIERASVDAAALFSTVDAVYIATPVSAHVRIAKTALEQGCHVLVEKPVSPGLDPAVPLLGLADRHRKIAATAYYRRLFPAAARLRSLLAAGGCGALESLEVQWCGSFDPGANDRMAWRTDPQQAGAGVLADVGSHRVDLLVWLLGPPGRLRAQLNDRFPAGAERHARLDLTWPSGTVGHVDLRWTKHSSDWIRLTFKRGILLFDLEAGTLHWREHHDVWDEVHPMSSNPHRPLVADFVASVRDDRPPVCPLSDGLITDRVIEAAIDSDARGRGWRPIEPVLLLR